MAGPNKLLMGIASLLGASLKRKREKADYLERLGLSQSYRRDESDRIYERGLEDSRLAEASRREDENRRWDRSRQATLSDAEAARLNKRATTLTTAGFPPTKEGWEGYTASRQQNRRVEEGVDAVKLFRDISPQIDTISPKDQATLNDPLYWYPENLEKRKKLKSEEATARIKRIIMNRLTRSPYDFSNRDAASAAETLLIPILDQAFGSGTLEAQMSAMALIKDRVTD